VVDVPTRQHALELVLSPDDDRSVRARWQLLEDAGVSSAARHHGPTHRPHVTVLAGPAPSAHVLQLAAVTWSSLLPLPLPVVALVLLGGARRPALADLLVAPGRAVAAREELRTAWPGADGRPWVPHLTLAPRLDLGRAAAALTALAQVDGTAGTARVAIGLRWWDPDTGSVRTVAGQGPGV
jgi:hypothetical protein